MEADIPLLPQFPLGGPDPNTGQIQELQLSQSQPEKVGASEDIGAVMQRLDQFEKFMLDQDRKLTEEVLEIKQIVTKMPEMIADLMRLG